MKKQGSLIAALVLLNFCSLVSVALAGSAKAQVTQMSGPVEWQKAGQDWTAVQPNQELQTGDRIRTGDLGNVTLQLEDGSSIVLASGSEMAIQILSKSGNKTESALSILKGKLTADTPPLKEGSTFEIETPIVVTAVRGTNQGVVVGQDGSVGVQVGNGQVDAKGESGENEFTIQLDDGKEVLVQKDTPKEGDIRIEAIAGPVTVILPDGSEQVLQTGDVIIINGGAATFIPAAGPLNEPDPVDALAEPASI